MSTFDGYIREISGIRFDNFTFSNTHPTPQHAHVFAYFLSHIHTDHLTGLDNPAFNSPVYCSPATAQILVNLATTISRIQWIEGVTVQNGSPVAQEKYGPNLPERRWGHLASNRAKGFNRRKIPPKRPPVLSIETSNTDGSAIKEEGEGEGPTKSNKKRKRDDSDSLLKVLEVGIRHEIDWRNNPHDLLGVTLIDANHCMGAVMFLIETSTTAILYTGDVRAEPWFVNSLSRNPLLQKYVHPDEYYIPPNDNNNNNNNNTRIQEKRSQSGSRGRGPTRLDNIYLDTAQVNGNYHLVSKEEAVLDLVTLLRIFPTRATFFLDAWTWGYEDMLVGVSRAFNTQIHLDPYKHKIYNLPSVKATDPALSTLSSLSSECCINPGKHVEVEARVSKTSTSSSFSSSSCSCGHPSFPCPCHCVPTRFHACERSWRCDEAWNDGRGCYHPNEDDARHFRGRKKKGKQRNLDYLSKRDHEDYNTGDAFHVYVSPGEIPREIWKVKFEAYRKGLEELRDKEAVGEKVSWPQRIDVPLSRHSTLPELRDLVKLFKPNSLFPNTVTAVRNHFCYPELHLLFKGCLAPGGIEELEKSYDTRKASWVAAHGQLAPPSYGFVTSLYEDNPLVFQIDSLKNVPSRHDNDNDPEEKALFDQLDNLLNPQKPESLSNVSQKATQNSDVLPQMEKPPNEPAALTSSVSSLHGLLNPTISLASGSTSLGQSTIRKDLSEQKHLPEQEENEKADVIPLDPPITITTTPPSNDQSFSPIPETPLSHQGDNEEGISAGLLEAIDRAAGADSMQSFGRNVIPDSSNTRTSQPSHSQMDNSPPRKRMRASPPQTHLSTPLPAASTSAHPGSSSPEQTKVTTTIIAQSQLLPEASPGLDKLSEHPPPSKRKLRQPSSNALSSFRREARSRVKAWKGGQGFTTSNLPPN